MAAPEIWVLRPGERLETDEFLHSRNGLFTAWMNVDGDFMIGLGDNWNQAANRVFQSWDTAYYKQWASKNPGRGPKPGYNKAIMEPPYFRVYQGGDTADRISWEVRGISRPANDGKLGIVLTNDGRLMIHPTNGTTAASFVTDASDRLVDEENIRWTKMKYGTAIITPNGLPKEFAAITADNDLPDGPAQQAKLIISYRQTHSKSWKTITTLKIGAKTTLEAGVPFVAKGRVEISAELSQGFEWNKVDTTENAQTFELDVLVPPKSSVMAFMTWQESSIRIPFKVTGVGTFASGKTAQISFDGVYDGIACWDLHPHWGPYKKGEENQARAMMLEEDPGTPLP